MIKAELLIKELNLKNSSEQYDLNLKIKEAEKTNEMLKLKEENANYSIQIIEFNEKIKKLTLEHEIT